MKYKSFYIILILLSSIALIGAGMVIGAIVESYLMGNYDLYNCIYRNADDNRFTTNPYLIEKIQDECICFREHNYTNLFEADC